MPMTEQARETCDQLISLYTTMIASINSEILAKRTAKFEARPGIREGDFVRTSDGEYIRICAIWDFGSADQTPHVQTTNGRFGASYHLDEEGYLSFSGGLDRGLPMHLLRPTGEQRDGSCWFFDRGVPRAHAGVDVTIPCRVFTCDYTAEQCRKGVDVSDG